jgi:hypothetical protein
MEFQFFINISLIDVKKGGNKINGKKKTLFIICNIEIFSLSLTRSIIPWRVFNDVYLCFAEQKA